MCEFWSYELQFQRFVYVAKFNIKYKNAECQSIFSEVTENKTKNLTHSRPMLTRISAKPTVQLQTYELKTLGLIFKSKNVNEFQNSAAKLERVPTHHHTYFS